jgi:hypothetical protein
MSVTLGRFNDGLKWARALNDDAKKNGWAEVRMMTPIHGPVNDLILEGEWPDLAAFEKEQNELYANAQAMATLRSGVGLDAPGTNPWIELEISVEQDLA